MFNYVISVKYNIRTLLYLATWCNNSIKLLLFEESIDSLCPWIGIPCRQQNNKLSNRIVMYSLFYIPDSLYFVSIIARINPVSFVQDSL